MYRHVLNRWFPSLSSPTTLKIPKEDSEWSTIHDEKKGLKYAKRSKQHHGIDFQSKSHSNVKILVDTICKISDKFHQTPSTNSDHSKRWHQKGKRCREKWSTTSRVLNTVLRLKNVLKRKIFYPSARSSEDGIIHFSQQRERYWCNALIYDKEHP